MNKLIIIPAFNPGNELNRLVNEIQKLMDLYILIIDDGSNPKIQILKNNLIIIRNDINYGKGFALNKGFAWGRKNGFKFAITMDADGQHSPGIIQEFINLGDEIDFGLGYRKFSGAMPFHRRLSNYLTSKLISIRISKNIVDSQCGYRRYNLELLSKYIFKEKGFQFETEVLLKTINNDSNISHISIPTIYGNEKSSIRHYYDTFKFISLFLRSFIW